jgi:uncharacterized protein
VRVEGNHALPVAKERVWSMLMDPAVLSRCLPGCEGLVKEGENDYRASIRIDHPAINGSYAGHVRMERLREPDSYRLIVEGRGAPGFLRAVSEVTLCIDSSGTGLRYSGDSRVGGPIAFLLGNFLRSKLDRLMHDFFAAVAREIRSMPA